MTIVLGNKKVKDVGSWQEFFRQIYSECVKKANERAVPKKEICLERARAEIKACEQYKNKPRIIQRARFLETYLIDKTVFIMDDELIVGNFSSKVKGVPISGYTGRYFEFQRVKDDPLNPSKMICKANVDLLKGTGIVSPEERKEPSCGRFPRWSVFLKPFCLSDVGVIINSHLALSSTQWWFANQIN